MRKIVMGRRKRQCKQQKWNSKEAIVAEAESKEERSKESEK